MRVFQYISYCLRSTTDKSFTGIRFFIILFLTRNKVVNIGKVRLISCRKGNDRKKISDLFIRVWGRRIFREVC